MNDQLILKIAEAMQKSQKTVVLSGAGMSTESGVPDFRSKDGLWFNMKPQDVATVEAFEQQYDTFHSFYQQRIHDLKQIEPHIGHKTIAKWQQFNLVDLVATQNVDGLHEMAGSDPVARLHGSIRTFHCADCQKAVTEEDFLTKQCPECGYGRVRPDITLFGEILPQRDWETALHEIKQADLVIVIGTSLEVYPVAELPSLTSGKTVYINKEAPPLASAFDIVLEGKAGEILQAIDRAL
ncbi:SIR2 family NAD-dependent protein deacylase [Salisediminibacterium halotolerans]|uniref:protein acetyllysine N-acetyltransferase n=1 Tax=Salisediminibacterium halotolerans TaxID=517425 RepID=A0A1H9RLD7_9BACI|nr:NAD-dependent deacylase [Salisediminibacterium haloalkalitolerans]SER73457.1 NAD-dependent deacetylase [Salisediminibacterium haloalkalitolerans]